MTQAATKQDVEDVLSEVRGLSEMVGHHFNDVHSEVKQTRADMRRIFRYLDSIEKQLEISEEERLVAAHQLERAYKWIKQLADKVGVKLEPSS